MTEPTFAEIAHLWRSFPPAPEAILVGGEQARFIERLESGYDGWHDMLEGVRATIEAPGFIND